MLNPNLQNNMKTELSRRFESFTKQQILEHQHIIYSHNQEMQCLRDSIKLALERFESLFQKTEQEVKDKTDSINNLLCKLQDAFKAHDINYSEQKQTILALFKELHNFFDICSTKKEIEKLKGDINLQIKACDISHINSFMEYQKEIKALYNSVKNDLTILKSENEKKFNELNEKIENKFFISLMDKEAVLKEVRIYEKSIFIAEKKIENIYTLIDRIKKGEVCHKQA